jgi:hypothetical protein
LMGHAHGERWTAEKIAAQLTPLAKAMNRMPSMPELTRAGHGRLANAITRSGGSMAWAKTIGMPLKESETRRGQAIEAAIADELRSLGFSVERQSTRAPFDLLVDGVRVDVKSGKYGEYKHKNGTLVRGHVFALNKVPATCDLYLLVGVDGENRPLWRYYIPASEAQVRTITITPTGKRYAAFKDDIAHLTRLIEQRRAA